LISGPAAADLRGIAEAIYSLTSAPQRGDLVRIDTKTALPDELRRVLAMADQSVGTLLIVDVGGLSASQQQDLANRLAGPGINWRVIGTLPEQQEGLPALNPALYHVLATMEIAFPPLAERLDDLPLLAQWQVEFFNRDNPKQLEGLTSEALQHLALYDWPGEVAELHEVLAAAHNKAAGPWIQVGDLPPLVRHAVAHARHLRKKVAPIDLDRYLEAVEGLLVRRAMELASGNKAEAARLLTLTRPRLYRKLERMEGSEAPPRRPPRAVPKPAPPSPPEPEELEIEFLPIDSPDDQPAP
jgi:DNA-binding NtrC family response regulator